MVVGVLFDGIVGILMFFKDGFLLGVVFMGFDSVIENLYFIVVFIVVKIEMILGICWRGY